MTITYPLLVNALIAGLLMGGFYATAAFALMWNAGRPGFWAALAVGAALSHYLLIWYTQRGISPGTPWGLISIGIAVPFLVGAERLVQWRDRMAGGTEALGVLAAGICFFIAAAIALELRREWITVAYAVELAAVDGSRDARAVVADLARRAVAVVDAQSGRDTDALAADRAAGALRTAAAAVRRVLRGVDACAAAARLARSAARHLAHAGDARLA